MAQETAAAIPTPEGGLLRAWIDAALHPKFTTFQRWFPRMQPGWRAISLYTTLILIVVEGLVSVVSYAAYNNHTRQALTLPDVVTYAFSYAFSPRGEFQFAYFVAGSVATLFAMPAVVTLISASSLGPYMIRFKRVYRPWVQSQPAICMLLILGWIIHILFVFFDTSATSFLSTVVVLVELILLSLTFWRAWEVSYQALAAGSGRTRFQAGVAAAIPGLLIWLLPSLLGHPVL